MSIMILVDTDIRKMVENGSLYCENGLSHDDMVRSIQAIAYDLHTNSYTRSKEVNFETCILAPGESVFVACKEIVKMPADVAGKIILRNSRIRQGLSLDAPVYQPGHHTRLFFRITNVSNAAIALTKDSSFASIMFEKLTSIPEKHYDGTFQGEMTYKDLADYDSEYSKEMNKFDEKVDEIKHLERNVYTNIITLMSIFIALFSIINVNIDLAFAENVERTRLIITNLVTVGSIAFLVSLTQLCLAHKSKRTVWIVMTIISVIILAGVALFAI